FSGIAALSRGMGELFNTPRLPKVGAPLPFAFVSHVAVDGDNKDVFVQLLSCLQQIAHLRNILFLTIGLADNHPLTFVLRRLLVKVEYRSTIFTVCWNDGEKTLSDIDSQRIPHPELAVL
ncbi:MAG: hypothetical protein AABY86_07945, partial [Bdellovibrionota bacterium]